MPVDTAPRPLNVVLVHGTWSEGLHRPLADRVRTTLKLPARARPTSGAQHWYHDDHAFGRRLRNALGARGFCVQMHPPLLWSGANTFAARANGGAALADRLADIHGPTLVIAHSHGGSVALHALAALDRARAAQIDLVTLNTPFLRAVRCVSPTQAMAFPTLGMLAFFAHMLAQARAQGISIADVLTLERFTTNNLGLLMSTMLPVLGAAVLIGDWFERSVVSRQVTRFSGRRLHCIRGVSDEAALGITGGLLASGLSRLVYGVVGRLALRRAVAAVGLLLLAGLSMATYGVVHVPPDVLRTASMVLDAAVLGAVGLWVVTALGNALLGAEFAAVGLLYMGSIDSTPDAAAGTLRVDTIAAAHGTADGLRHSAAYEREDVIDLIADAAAARA